MRPGQDFVVEVQATPTQPLVGGTITMSVKKRGIVVSTRTFELCKDISVQCPAAPKKAIKAIFHFPVPWFAPTMRADVVISVVDVHGQPLACVEAPQVPVVRQLGFDPVNATARALHHCERFVLGRRWCEHWHAIAADVFLFL